jgi:hypothetical protein
MKRSIYLTLRWEWGNVWKGIGHDNMRFLRSGKSGITKYCRVWIDDI